MSKRKGIDPIQNLEDVSRCLSKTAFPALKRDIFSEALREGLNMNVMTLIQSLPNKLFISRKDVFANMGLMFY